MVANGSRLKGRRRRRRRRCGSSRWWWRCSRGGGGSPRRLAPPDEAARRRFIQVAATERGPPGAPPRWRLSIRLFDHHAGADVAEFAETDGVPVGEAEAAMRLGSADLLGPGRSVDAVGREGESDPCEAHGVVGARRVDVLRAGAGRVGRVGVVGVGNHRDHLDLAGGRSLVLLGRD